jgi:hypothetical protein
MYELLVLCFDAARLSEAEIEDVIDIHIQMWGRPMAQRPTLVQKQIPTIIGTRQQLNEAGIRERIDNAARILKRAKVGEHHPRRILVLQSRHEMLIDTWFAMALEEMTGRFPDRICRFKYAGDEYDEIVEEPISIMPMHRMFHGTDD